MRYNTHACIVYEMLQIVWIERAMSDKQLFVISISRTYDAIKCGFRSFCSFFKPSSKALDDFTTRADIPSLKEYEAASCFQILDRFNRNPCGLENEEAFINTLINIRNAENNRKRTVYLAATTCIIAIAAVILVFLTANPPIEKTQELSMVQKQVMEQGIGNAMELLRGEFNQKLQNKDNEIKDLRRQVSLLNQVQAGLTKQLKATPKPANPAPKPEAVNRPKKTSNVGQR